jgi:hypothetical protein
MEKGKGISKKVIKERQETRDKRRVMQIVKVMFKGMQTGEGGRREKVDKKRLMQTGERGRIEKN